MSARSPADENRAACSPCGGSGRVVSMRGGSAHSVVCPWCEGSGRFQPGHDAQAAGAPAPAAVSAQP